MHGKEAVMQTERNERIHDRLVQEEQEDATNAYSPTMSDAEIEALIARLDEHSQQWAREQTKPTDSVKMLRTLRTHRLNAIKRHA